MFPSPVHHSVVRRDRFSSRMHLSKGRRRFLSWVHHRTGEIGSRPVNATIKGGGTGKKEYRAENHESRAPRRKFAQLEAQ